MSLIIEIILQFFIEFIITVAPDLGIACLTHTAKRPPARNNVVAALGYGVLGLIIGGISLLLFPDSFAKSAGVRVTILFLAPVSAGFFMACLRSYREKQGKDVARIESFFFGTLLAFGVAAVRFVYAHHNNA